MIKLGDLKALYMYMYTDVGNVSRMPYEFHVRDTMISLLVQSLISKLCNALGKIPLVSRSGNLWRSHRLEGAAKFGGLIVLERVQKRANFNDF